MMKKDWIIGALATVALVIAVVGIGGTNQSLKKISSQLAGMSSAPSDVFGGNTRFPNSDLTAKSIFSQNGYRFGTQTDGTLTNGYTEKVLNVDLNATSSAGTLNPEGVTIWVYDASVRIQTATTSAISYLMGTTTAGIVGANDTCGVNDTCVGANSGMASILNTGTAAATTVGNTFFKLDYQGTDTRDGSGVRYVVPVTSTNYLTCFASTTPADFYQVGGQAAQCQFKYFVMAD